MAWYKTPRIAWNWADYTAEENSLHIEISRWCIDSFGTGNMGSISNFDDIQYMFRRKEAVSMFLLRWPNLNYKKDYVNDKSL